mmetsp:Transcript_1762/g.2249  ORF Transcript_1762/g.2249 Transcript_1762/m.2249 type:complete len:85 (+) Transcript_1762:3025-3279(+)
MRNVRVIDHHQHQMSNRNRSRRSEGDTIKEAKAMLQFSAQKPKNGNCWFFHFIGEASLLSLKLMGTHSQASLCLGDVASWDDCE